MSIPTATVHVAGQAVTWSAIDSNLDSYRSWINDIRTADIAASAVQTEHVVRPRLSRIFYGERRMIVPIEYGLADAPPNTSEAAWAPNPRRLTMDPSKYSVGEVWRFPLGATIRVPPTPDMPQGTGRIGPQLTFSLTCSLLIRSPTAATAVYPDGADPLVDRGGYLSLYTYNREYGVETERPETRNFLYPMINYGAYTDRANFLFQSASADVGTDEFRIGDTYDFYIGYARSTATLNIAQIDITRAVGKIDIAW